MIRVVVTREDIAGARPCDPEYCPIARAVTRLGVQKPWVVGIGVHPGAAVLEYMRDGRKQTATLPLEAWEFASNFDRGEPVGSLAFDLDVTP